MRFNPEEAVLLMKEGKTDIKVIDSIDYVSKSSNKESIKITMKAWDETGKEGTIIAYISHPWQLKAVCLCLGVPIEEFNTGEIPASRFRGLSGKVMNKVEKSENPNYEDKNVVAKWLKKEDKEKPEEAEFKDDDIPF